ncbi:hypothetical protein PT282_05710 [Bifidobacterium sp. ESL0763]|nr:hypothetical protein [Bifidobacterium sp. ESL0763]
MAASARTVRSNVAPAGREREPYAAPSRPKLKLVDNEQARGGEGLSARLDSFSEWVRGRSVPGVHIILVVVFLVASVLCSLGFRTLMAQNSFEQTQVQGNITKLNQDIEDDQADLDRLQAGLPDKAQKMGMVPQQGSVSIDLQGYQPSQGAQ